MQLLDKVYTEEEGRKSDLESYWGWGWAGGEGGNSNFDFMHSQVLS